MNFRRITVQKQGFFKPQFLFFENDVLKYKGKISGFLNKAELYDRDGNLAMKCHKDWKRFKKVYDLSKDGRQIGLVRIKWGMTKDKILVESTYGDYEIRGNWRGKEYDVFKGEAEVAKISRKSAWNFEFGMAFKEEEDIEIMLKILLSIILHLKIKQASSG